ncbi:hypothetical protein TWF718_001935 [Orbilia javanica]|uniref:Uncharacterized protein n=1 Tax=Orbilia javanica TaxID=47235 RepID=A0AAN8RNP9_9PEZI
MAVRRFLNEVIRRLGVKKPRWTPPSPTLTKEFTLPPLPLPPLLPTTAKPPSSTMTTPDSNPKIQKKTNAKAKTKTKTLTPRAPFFGFHFTYYKPGAVRTPVLRYSPYRGYYKKMRRRSEGSRYIDRGVGIRGVEGYINTATIVTTSTPSTITPATSTGNTSLGGITTTTPEAPTQRLYNRDNINTHPPQPQPPKTPPITPLHRRKIITITEYPVETKIETIRIPKPSITTRSTTTKTETETVATTITVTKTLTAAVDPPFSRSISTVKTTRAQNTPTPKRSTIPTSQKANAPEAITTTATTTFTATATRTRTVVLLKPKSKKDLPTAITSSSSTSTPHPPNPTTTTTTTAPPPPPSPSTLPSSLSFLRPPTTYYEPPGITPCPCPSMTSQIQLTNNPLPPPPPSPDQDKDAAKKLKRSETGFPRRLESILEKILSYIRPKDSTLPSCKPLPKREEGQGIQIGPQNESPKDPGRKIELDAKPVCPCLHRNNEPIDAKEDGRKLPVIPYYKVKKRGVDPGFETENGNKGRRWKG